MVMRRNAMRKNLTQSILRSLGRYIAILSIIALGCALFVGLKVTKKDMIITGQQYMDGQNMFDLKLLNTYGWTQTEVDAISGLEGVLDVEGSIYLDAYAQAGTQESSVFRFYSIPHKINRVYLLSGRMPENGEECLVDGGTFDTSMIGKQITIAQTNEDQTLESFRSHTYTVVGCISTPLYMDMTRGSTSLGSGVLSAYIYLPEEAFQVDYYTEIFVTLPGDKTIYTEGFTKQMDGAAERLKTALQPLAQKRYEKLRLEAEQEYTDGLQKYEDGRKEYEDGKKEALQTLADALKELEDAQQKIDTGWAEITDGQAQLEKAQQQITDGKGQLDDAKLQLENKKAEVYKQIADAYTQLLENYKLVTENLRQVEDGLEQVEDGIAQVDSGLSQIQQNLPLLELMLRLLETQVQATQTALDAAKLTGDENLIQALETELEKQTAELSEYQTQLEQAQKTQAELEQTRTELGAKREELFQARTVLQESQKTIDLGLVELETSRSVAESEFSAAEAQISAGYLELEAGQTELDTKVRELEAGKAELADAQAQLDEGRAEYEKGKTEAEAELAEGEEQLAQAWADLEAGRKQIDEMTAPDVFALTRDSNAGYLALDSNSNIVSGIAKVLPVFFLLIAALVCITTMTRMVEEERTQIGTLKALGHRNGAIMGKYLGYSASAALVGCGLGVAVGCTFFPKLLWNAYGIIFNICPDIELTVDWGLCLGITGAYLGVSTMVTWYCCRRTLREVPAELIRPKAPKAGKKTLLEYLPLWKKLSFLNKVMLRNVFRYRQRFLMMLIGIGGCTALLLTGFGLRDTIVDIANVQFEEVNHFDLEVYFSEGQSAEDKQAFLERLKEENIAYTAGFFYQTSVELEFDGKVRDVYMISAEEQIKEYLTFQRNDQMLHMPGVGEAYISVGVAELLDIGIGDEISVRTGDMKVLNLQVTGIYENYVNNYVIVTPETVAQQWGQAPLEQMAFLKTGEDQDVHEASAVVSELKDVVNITICEDSAEMVGSMMQALDMVVVVIVFCAGLLAAIVLYNLTNININERIREIATIKVLGFQAAETSAYVFKENILLTVLGTGFGLALGRIFLEFVMMNIKVDMVWFKTRLTAPSYIYAVLLTLLCAAAVDFVFHFKLQKINMAEALKSVE